MSSTEPTTRERILRATWRLMEEQQGRGVRLEDVARASGVSRQAVYLHFHSRAELLTATARYLDEALGLEDRLRPLTRDLGGIKALDAYVEFWGNYIPDIYGLAKALMTVRETDEAAAAAWDDRMAALRQGCQTIVQCLQRDAVLAREWTIDEATDFCWSALSIASWENLTIECGWSKDQYIERMRMVLRRALIKSPQAPTDHS